mmetsp:Transcript_52775/g.125619  ORF Transcript_52775/g.125619 Transcript_52775/m.125619 type:complete len:216 (+) Transcript_52775:972-1619(+)
MVVWLFCAESIFSFASFSASTEDGISAQESERLSDQCCCAAWTAEVADSRFLAKALDSMYVNLIAPRYASATSAATAFLSSTAYDASSAASFVTSRCRPSTSPTAILVTCTPSSARWTRILLLSAACSTLFWRRLAWRRSSTASRFRNAALSLRALDARASRARAFCSRASSASRRESLSEELRCARATFSRAHEICSAATKWRALDCSAIARSS